MSYDDALWSSRLDSTGKPCAACGHAEPHDRTEYEDTHARCQHVAYVREPYSCVPFEDEYRLIYPPVPNEIPLDKYSKRCEARGDEVVNGVKVYACWRRPVPCECSWEDREIAALRAQLRGQR